jgi:hypothetical protein
LSGPRILGVGHDVGDVNYLARQSNAADAARPISEMRVILVVFVDPGFATVTRGESKNLTVGQVQLSVVGGAEPS